MVATLNYELKNAPVGLWESSRWTVLTMLILHANIRNRCWTSIDYLASKLGKSTATVESALKWLRKVGALEVVPFKERVGSEKQLPNRQHVYQLTGKLSDGENSTSYLYVSPVNGQAQDQVLESKTSDGKVLKTETSKPEGHVLDSKTFKNQNLTIPIEESTIPKDSAGSANATPADAPAKAVEPEPKREDVEDKPTAVKEGLKAIAEKARKPKPQDAYFEAAESFLDAIDRKRLPPGVAEKPIMGLAKTWVQDKVDTACLGFLIAAWLDANVVAPLLAWQVGEITMLTRLAWGMCQNGITAADVTDYVKETYAAKDPNGRQFWNGKAISFGHVANNVGIWKKAKAPAAPAKRKADPHCPICHGDGIYSVRDANGIDLGYSVDCDCKEVRRV
jgi:helix-turn-helix protein